MKKWLLAALCSLFLTPAQATVSCTIPVTLIQGTTANATDVMADFTAMVNCFAVAASSGANSDITSLSGLTTPITPSQGGANVFVGGTATGVGNSITVASTTPNTFVLQQGLVVTFVASNGNTGPTQANIHGTGLKNVFRQTQNGPIALSGNEISANNPVWLYYDGTQFILLNPGTQFGGFGPLGVVTVAAGVADITPVGGHFANITSATTTITSFGTTANTANGIYLVFFTNPQTITTGGNISLLPGGGASLSVATNDVALVWFSGTNWFIFGVFKTSGAAVSNPVPLCGASGLVINNLIGTPNTQITYSAAQATLVNPANNTVQYGITIAGTNNTGTGNVTSTADGMDGETPPAPGFIFIWLIGNGTNINSLASTSSTAPTMPAGFSFRCRVGAMRFDASPNLFRTKQIGQHVQYVVTAGSANTTTLPNAANGIAGTYSTTAPVWVAVSLSSHVPSTAAKANLVIDNNWKAAGISNVQVAPNNAYGGYASAAGNPAPFDFVPAAANFMSASISILLETQQFFWAASGAGGAVSVLGWEDSANVN